MTPPLTLRRARFVCEGRDPSPGVVSYDQAAGVAAFINPNGRTNQ
jgi:hypothetical protein